MARFARQKLTDRFVGSRRKAAAGQRDEYPDGLVPGLELRVTDTGHRSFVLVARYPLNPKNPTRRALGDCYVPAKGQAGPAPAREIRNGSLTLAEARAKARDWVDLIGRGIDPKVEEARQRAAAQRSQVNSFAAVAAAFLERHVKGPAYVELERRAAEVAEKESSLSKDEAFARVCADPGNRALVQKSRREGIAKKAEAERIINAEFLKRWGSRPFGEIMPEEIAVAIRAIVKRGSPYQAHNALGYLRRLYSWAIGTNEFGVTASPVERLRPKDLIGKKEARDRVLADHELRVVWQATDMLGYPYGPLIKLLMLTGQREREIGDASWSEIDFGKKQLVIGAARMKGSAAHLVPLAPEALKIVEALPRHTGGAFVFSTSNGTKSVNGYSKCKVRLDGVAAKIRAAARLGKDFADVKAEEVEDADRLPPFVLHDLRRSARTGFSALPVEDIVREAVIAHRRGGIHAVYDLHSYAAEKRRCLELWEAHLKGIVSPKPPADVADLGKERAKRDSER